MQLRTIPIILILLTLSLQAGIGEGESEVAPLPVELTSFSASVKGDVVLLNWRTATELNNYGFEIETSALGTHLGTPLSSQWTKIGFVEGHGNSNSPKSYSFVDNERNSPFEVMKNSF